MLWRIILAPLLPGLVAPAQQPSARPNQADAKSAPALALASSAFKPNATIPSLYTADGKDISPPLMWANLPDGTQSLVLVCDDPDALRGAWVHWVVYNISPKLAGLRAGVVRKEEIADQLKQGLNSWEKLGYNGPAPPPGQPHRYAFKLHALDVVLDLPGGAGCDRVMRAASGHILAKTSLTGTYGRAP